LQEKRVAQTERFIKKYIFYPLSFSTTNTTYLMRYAIKAIDFLKQVVIMIFHFYHSFNTTPKTGGKGGEP